MANKPFYETVNEWDGKYSIKKVDGRYVKTRIADPDPTSNIANDAVDTNNIKDGAVTIEKIDAPMASNPNLLDNWWFGDGVINQRGFTSVTNGGFIVDRWKNYQAGTMTLSGGCINLTAGYLYQTIDTDFVALEEGEVYTASVMLRSGEIISGQAEYHIGETSVFVSDSRFDMQFNGSVPVHFEINAKSALNIKAFKLERGKFSTLAKDAPPNPFFELAKCKRYCQVYSGWGFPILSGDAVNATRAIFKLEQPMRATPSVSFLLDGASATLSNAKPTVYSNGKIFYATNLFGQLTGYIELTISGATAHTAASFSFSSSAKLILSADL